MTRMLGKAVARSMASMERGMAYRDRRGGVDVDHAASNSIARA